MHDKIRFHTAHLVENMLEIETTQRLPMKWKTCSFHLGLITFETSSEDIFQQNLSAKQGYFVLLRT